MSQPRQEHHAPAPGQTSSDGRGGSETVVSLKADLLRWGLFNRHSHRRKEIQKYLATVRRILPHFPINPLGLRSQRLVYYRLYTKDGPITSNNPIYANDPFLSRTLTKFITPPHTALTVKGHICSIESLPRTTECSLFESLSSLTAIENTARLSIRGSSGPGLSEHEPIILVTGSQDVERSPPKLEPGMLPDAALHEPRYRT